MDRATNKLKVVFQVWACGNLDGFEAAHPSTTTMSVEVMGALDVNAVTSLGSWKNVEGEPLDAG